MTFDVDPMPEMVSQRLLPAFMSTLPIIDPTCGRYCLKALLKHHYERLFDIRAPDITLPRPKIRWKDWMAYDPYHDFQLGPEMLFVSSCIPDGPQGWEYLLEDHGPIILSGVLGQARIPHYVLLVGTITDGDGTFRFKDPLVGDAIREESFPTMQPRIKQRIFYARQAINSVFRAHTELLQPNNVVNIVFGS